MRRRSRKVSPLNGAAHELADPRDDNPADWLERKDLGEQVLRLVDGLPEGQRTALLLWAEGFEHVEIARITGQTTGHVRVLVHRGLKTLRERARGLDA